MNYIKIDSDGNETVYQGFRRFKDPTTVKIVAVVVFEYEIELYETTQNVTLVETEIKRLYMDDYDREPESITFFYR